MTRAEYQAKYGTAPTVTSTSTVATPTTTSPVKMTRAEYTAKYGVSPETQSTEKSSLLDKTMGIAKGFVSAPATMIARPFQLVAELAGVSPETLDKFSKEKLGGFVAPVPQNVADIKKEVGRGMQTVALGLPLTSGGLAFGVGSSLEQGNDLFSAQTAFQGILGVAGAKILGLVGKPLLDVAGKVVGKITPKVLKDVALKGTKAMTEFAATHNILSQKASQAITVGAKKMEVVINKPFKVAGNRVGAFSKKVFQKTPAIPKIREKAQGIFQTGKEFVERAPRAFSKLKESVVEAGVRAEKIKISTPATQNAIKTNLDERIINTVGQADKATKQAYRDVLSIAEESPKTIGVKKQPTIVGGDLASKQYDFVIKQKKSVGKKMGDFANKLSKTEQVNMQDGFRKIDDILSNQGISPIYTKKGTKLDFTGSGYTPAERTKIQELYNLAIEGGDNISPRQILDKDKLFSKLKRQSNFEGIGDLMVGTPERDKSLFSVFRDVYSKKLDAVSPTMRGLNKEYRILAQLMDDLEDSIFKTPNFNVTKSVDPAEFAKVNLRRIFGEAQSSPAFEAVADAMDIASRRLGYKGASPKAVAEFAQELRKLFPETIPKTGFTGGIRVGLGDLVETITKIGAPNIKDQQKALRMLLDESLGIPKKVSII